MIVEIGGKAVNYRHASFDYEDAIGQRSTASFTIVDPVGNQRYNKGQPVYIYNDDGAENVLRGADLSNISQWGTTSLESTTDQNGNTQVKATQGGTSNFGLQIRPYLSKYKAGKTYTISFLARGNVTRFDYVYLMRADGANSSFDTVNVSLSTTEYKRVVMRITPAWSTEQGYALIGVQQASGTWFEVKEVAIVEGLEPMKEWHVNPYDTTPVFGGVIDRPVAKYQSLAGNGKFHAIVCTDWHYIADKRIVARLYQNKQAGEIFEDLVVRYLEEEGITVGNIQMGPLVTEAVFNYVSLTNCFEGLSEKAGFEWNINPDKTIDFFARSSYAAPVDFDETSDIKNVDVEPAAEDYRNKQYIRAGKDITDPQTERFRGNDSNQTFTVGYPIAKVPTISVNGQAVSRVGIRGLESGFDWYWTKGSNAITQDDQSTPLSGNDVVEVIYQGFMDIVALSYDQGAIDEMQSVEGGTGIHEDVIDDPYITSRAAAFETASAKLRRYARIGNKVTFDTKVKGLMAGQLTNINLPSFGINTDFIIESVKASEMGTHDGKLMYTVTAVDGQATGGWAKFFKSMATRGQAFVLRENIREDEMLILLEQFSRTWQESDNPNIFKHLYPAANLYPGAELWPSFNADENRVRYLTFYDANNNEIFRKSFSKQEAIDDRIITTVLVMPFESNGIAISHVGWIGGEHATGAFNTGTLVDKQPFSRTKTELESWQMQKTDLKGW